MTAEVRVRFNRGVSASHVGVIADGVAARLAIVRRIDSSAGLVLHRSTGIEKVWGAWPFRNE